MVIYTQRAATGYTANAYTTVGTYTTGWTEYRVVLDFTTDTYTLSKRARLGRRLDAAQGRRRPHLRHPDARGRRPDHHGQPALPRLSELQPVDRRVAFGSVVQPTITAGAGTGGSIAPVGVQTVAYGGSQAYAIAPASGYVINDVVVDGTSVGAVTSYTFTNVRTDHTISATFRVPSAADMPITPVDCSKCHAGMDHGEGPNCGDCHDISEGHPGTPSDMHTPADVTGCTPCHNPSLTVEHNGRTPDAGGPFTCNTCHESTAPLVVNAIATGNSACDACHPAGGGHIVQHETTTPVSCQGAGCHNQTNLVPIHLAIGCEGCHSSADPLVVNAIATNNKNCSACHPAPHAAVHDHDGARDLPGRGLPRPGHQPGADPHRDRLCGLPRESTDPLVIAAITAGNTACVACHPAPHGPPLHDTTVPATCQGAGCHAPATNLVPIHTAIGCAGCHASTNPRRDRRHRRRQHRLRRLPSG